MYSNKTVYSIDFYCNQIFHMSIIGETLQQKHKNRGNFYISHNYTTTSNSWHCSMTDKMQQLLPKTI